jgi:hypothetical protein
MHTNALQRVREKTTCRNSAYTQQKPFSAAEEQALALQQHHLSDVSYCPAARSMPKYNTSVVQSADGILY